MKRFLLIALMLMLGIPSALAFLRGGTSQQFAQFFWDGTPGSGTAYSTFSGLCSGGTAGHTFYVVFNPTGNYGVSPSCNLTGKPGTTLQMNSAVAVYGVNGNCESGVAEICLASNNLTLNGAGATVGRVNPSFTNAVISYLPGFTGITISGASGNPFVIDCGGYFGGEWQGDTTTGLLTSYSTDTKTISHVKIWGCGGSGGQNHAMYLTWGGASAANFTYCENLNDITVQDAIGDTTAIKIDPLCSNATPGSITNLAVYCTVEGEAGGNCDENEPLDFQCGGNHVVTNSLFEIYGQPGTNDQGTFSKINWGSQAVGGCQPQWGTSTGGPTDSVHFDKDIFIYDGHMYTSAIVACGSAKDGSGCQANAGPNVSTSSTTSLTVGTGTQNLTVGTSLNATAMAVNNYILVDETSSSSNFMMLKIVSYNSTTGALSGTVLYNGGSGTFTDWTVTTPPHANVCITNSQIVEDDDNGNALTLGGGVYVASGCASTGTDSNTYYRGQTGTANAGRKLACSATNWSAGSGTNCVFPFVPAYLAHNETHDQLVAEAHAAGRCGAGTASDPIHECLLEKIALGL